MHCLQEAVDIEILKRFGDHSRVSRSQVRKKISYYSSLSTTWMRSEVNKDIFVARHAVTSRAEKSPREDILHV